MKCLSDEEIQRRVNEMTDELVLVGFAGDKRGKSGTGIFEHTVCGETFHRNIGNVVYQKVITCPTCNPGSFTRTTKQLARLIEKKGYTLLNDAAKDRETAEVMYECGCTGRHLVGSLLSKLPPKCPTHTEGYRMHGSLESLQAELKSLPLGSFTIVGPVINRSRPFDVRCDSCEGDFRLESFQNLKTAGGKCPLCSRTVKSVREEFVSTCLSDLGIKFQREYRIGRFRYDFFLPEMNILIEYDGAQHDNGRWLNNTIPLNDSEKDALAVESGFKLVRIRHDESVILAILSLQKGSTTIRKE